MRATGKPVAVERPAGIMTRILAGIVDMVVIGLIATGSYLGVAFVRLLIDPRNFTWPGNGLLLSMLGASIIAILYLTFFWATSGRTIGGALLGTRVVGANQVVLRWASSLLRAAFYVIFPIGLFWVIIDSRRRSLQDIVLRTVVIYDWRVRPPDTLR